MPLGMILTQDIARSAGIAYLHYFSFMLCFGSLVLERKLLKTAPNRQEAISLLVTDVVYGFAALILLTSGILRVLYFGQGTDFYTHNPIFWIKVGIFILVGAISLYPTFTYILWAIPLSKGELPTVNLVLVRRLGMIINIELIGFVLIPLFATLMSRGIGLIT
tara:strand:+ start:2454 stop:2942 length:489 start_codon:yes stop_codon:yes gene_type:complete